MIEVQLTLDTPLADVRIASEQQLEAERMGLPVAQPPENPDLEKSNSSTDHGKSSSANSLDTVCELLESINEAICDVETRRQQSLHELRKVAIELSVVVASKLLYQSIEMSQFPIETLVDEAVSHLLTDEPQSIIVRLNPKDTALLQQQLEQDENSTNQLNEMNVQADSSLNRGTCEVTVGDTGVMLDLETKVNELRMSLLGTLTDAETERRKTSADGRDMRRFPDRRETA